MFRFCLVDGPMKVKRSFGFYLKNTIQENQLAGLNECILLISPFFSNKRILLYSKDIIKIPPVRKIITGSIRIVIDQDMAADDSRANTQGGAKLWSAVPGEITEINVPDGQDMRIFLLFIEFCFLFILKESG